MRKAGRWAWRGWWHRCLGPKRQAWESQGLLGVWLGKALPCFL